MQERTEITTEVFGVVLGLLRKLIRFEPNIQTYVSIAGDDSAEMRRTAGIFAVNRERTIDLLVEKANSNIEYCFIYALSAIVDEERDQWFARTKIHANQIKRLEVEQLAVRRILAMELPWPDLIRTALGVAKVTGNTQLMDQTTHTSLMDAIKSTEGSSAPPPGEESDTPALPEPDATETPLIPPESKETPKDKDKSKDAK